MLIAIAASIEDSTPVRRYANRISARGIVRGAPLTEAQIAGSLSLIDHLPLSIAAVPGLIVRVRSGALWATQSNEGTDHVVRAGGRFVVDRAGPLVISALATTELHIEWPVRGFERLSPGLEPVDAVA